MQKEDWVPDLLLLWARKPPDQELLASKQLEFKAEVTADLHLLRRRHACNPARRAGCRLGGAFLGGSRQVRWGHGKGAQVDFAFWQCGHQQEEDGRRAAAGVLSVLQYRRQKTQPPVQGGSRRGQAVAATVAAGVDGRR
ncbi:hypothetical protein NDU88_002542 [Pleurodeles waltl]|uniref:Uncharacterized protein n=1 Tax=Pleurodeles waltl TaxID=8319 RepID=A0AAV7M8H4_PLEWA|nr:hypothetical protein NDU88_002542 [Pleurodeles waltl]